MNEQSSRLAQHPSALAVRQPDDIKRHAPRKRQVEHAPLKLVTACIGGAGRKVARTVVAACKQALDGSKSRSVS
eukprot:CAMPEP_0181219790 /NCGR_PEP_ID=MMETSP1096-20121128/28478_1 /TAXON_ID=156174 ORGANISM="Chrysochromulina ericina, Strain CCMP281" /NCGR_SAMPLE_ID=MMETSP1096 /ASSEMBLY_ACC=CAM_ASM_000453 /LENGTH=73 /DNA_ID=CAMNT_0023312223 /DNA_START=468 /DNA_END=686 /DNA_ORIENTATION=-